MPLPNHSSNQDIYDQIELLEQSITLTLQQIDQNFASCHSVVATKLLPQVDRFGETSAQIWDGCQAWLQFFQGLEGNYASSSSLNTLPFPPSPTDSRTSHCTVDPQSTPRPSHPFTSEASAIAEDELGRLDPHSRDPPIHRSILSGSSSSFSTPSLIHHPRHATGPSRDNAPHPASPLESPIPPKLRIPITSDAPSSILSSPRPPTQTPLRARPPRPAGTKEIVSSILRKRNSPNALDPRALFDLQDPMLDDYSSSSNGSTSEGDGDGQENSHASRGVEGMDDDGTGLVLPSSSSSPSSPSNRKGPSIFSPARKGDHEETLADQSFDSDLPPIPAESSLITRDLIQTTEVPPRQDHEER